MEIVSVVTPIYKGAKYIPGLISQLKANIFQVRHYNYSLNLELVLVNDFPEEKIEIENYLDSDLSVVLINNEKNYGIHYSRVAGLKASTGNYLIFLDQDDYLHPDFLIKTYEAIYKNNEGVVATNAWMENEKLSKRKLYSTSGQVANINNIDAYVYSHNQIVSPGQCLIKKSIIPDEWTNNILMTNGSDDLLLWILLLCKGERLLYIDECLYTHKYTGVNLSSSGVKMSRSSLDLVNILRNISYVESRVTLVLFRSRTMNIEASERNGFNKWAIYYKYRNILMHRIIIKLRSMA